MTWVARNQVLVKVAALTVICGVYAGLYLAGVLHSGSAALAGMIGAVWLFAVAFLLADTRARQLQKTVDVQQLILRDTENDRQEMHRLLAEYHDKTRE